MGYFRGSLFRFLTAYTADRIQEVLDALLDSWKQTDKRMYIQSGLMTGRR